LIDFKQGNASQMPYPDESFDFVVCQAAFKNFAEYLRAPENTVRGWRYRWVAENNLSRPLGQCLRIGLGT
jgi:ubiquinone/menaquinone biosynthesis C-methylase UbiE